MTIYTETDFRQLFDPAEKFDIWLATEFLQVRSDGPTPGIWLDVDELDRVPALHRSERDMILQRHPRGDLSLPVLPLPFAMADFMLLANSDCFRHSSASSPDDEAVRRAEGINPGTAALISALRGDKLARKGRPRGSQAQQEVAILDAIRKIGHNPAEMPKAPSGRPGVKAVAWAAVSEDALFVSRKTFDLAWERLRREGRIADKVQPDPNSPSN